MYIYRKSVLGHRIILWFCFRRKNESRASILNMCIDPPPHSLNPKMENFLFLLNLYIL